MPGLYSATDEERRAAEQELARGLAAEGVEGAVPPTLGEWPPPVPPQDAPAPLPDIEVPSGIDTPAQVAMTAPTHPAELSEDPILATDEPPPGEPPSFPAAARALDQAQGQAYRAAGAVRQIGHVKAEGADRVADAQDSVVSEKKAQVQALSDQAKAHKIGQELAHEQTDAAQERYRGFTFDKWWDKQDTATKLLTNVSLFLGGFVAGVRGGPNQALQQMNRVIEADFREQREKLGQLKTFAEWRRQGEQDLAGRYQVEKAHLLTKQGRATEALAEQVKAEILRNRGTEEMANANATYRGLLAEADEKKAKGLATLAQYQAMIALAKIRAVSTNPLFQPTTPAMAELARLAADPNTTEQEMRTFAAEKKLPFKAAEMIITNATSRQKPNAEQAKNAVHGRQMLLALDGLKNDKLDAHNPSQDAVQKWLSNQEQIEGAAARNKSLLGQIGNWGARKLDKIPANEFEGLDKKDRQYFIYAKQWIEGYGREKSGAAITLGEWTNFFNQVGPQAGEAGRRLARQTAQDMAELGGVASARLVRGDEARAIKSGDERHQAEAPPAFLKKPAAKANPNGGKPTVTKADEDLLNELEGAP